MNEKIAKLNEELERERHKSKALEDSMKELAESITAKDNESVICGQKLEELIEKKKKFQKECTSLRNENKALIKSNAELEIKYEELKSRITTTEENSREKTDELRVLLKKNSNLLKQISVLQNNTDRIWKKKTRKLTSYQ